MAGSNRNSPARSTEPSPARSRRSTRSRSVANSPSIAPLPSDGPGSPPQSGLPAIPEDSGAMEVDQNDNGNTQPAASQQEHTVNNTQPQQQQPEQSQSIGMHATPMRSMGTPAHGNASQGVGRTPGTRPRHVRGDLPNQLPKPRGRAVPGVGVSGAISGDIAPVEDGGDIPDNTFIWGTKISVAAVNIATSRFFNTYRDPQDGPAGRPKYVQLVVQAVQNGDNIVNVDSGDLRSMDRELYHRLVEYPREVLPLFDEVARDVALENVDNLDATNPPYITVRVFNLDKSRTIRDLNPEDIDTLVSVQGMVTRTSPVIPELKVAFFKCQRCSRPLEVLNLDGRVQEPEKCGGCGAKLSLDLIHNLSTFTNKQMVKMQEKPDDIPEGETPHSVVMYVFDANVDVCRPGDRVTITGTYRAAPIRVNPRHRILHSTFRTFIDVMHVQRDEAGRLFTVAAAREEQEQANKPDLPGGVSGISGTSLPASTSAAPTGSQAPHATQDRFFQQEDEAQHGQLGAATMDQVKARTRQLQELAAHPQIYDRLVASLAPNIYGMDDVKKGLLCQLFGGTGKTFPGGRVRGEINVLLVGDPSVSKSQLLTYMHSLAPRGMYTSGKGSSATGLTAYVARDPETNELVLESGALVMSDRGICCIDEFDKMSESSRAMLHETMEQQTVSIAKAGLISTLNARTSICACANPIGSRYNPSLTVSENINLPPTLLTRFDLIYLVLDKFDESTDLQLARHLISMYHEGSRGANRPQAAVETIPQDLLREYIAYARARITPKISNAAADELARVYASMRQDGRAKKVVVATPRQLESLIRLAEAQARMRLATTVEKDHVIEATRLWFQAMSAASPGEGGGIDQDALTSGMTAAQRRTQQQLPGELARMLAAAGSNGVTSITELMDGLGHLGITREGLIAALKSLSGIISLDERTGVVRARSALGTAAGSAAPRTAAAEAVEVA